MKRAIWATALICCSAVVVWAAQSQTPLPTGALFDYQVKTIRAHRVEIVDDAGRIRMILDVHKDIPAVTFYGEDGEPARVVTVADAGLIVGE